jgi:hypothetical protein
VRNAFPVSITNRQFIEEGPRLRHRSVGIVGGKHDPIHTDLQEQVEEIRSEIETDKSVVSESTCMSIPAASISAILFPPISQSLSTILAMPPPETFARSASLRPGVAKCSSSVIVRISIFYFMRRS